jgi:NCS1 family nucleobase:cation symporter-1
MSKRKGGAIESRSIDWIPDDERHGKVWQQGPLWFLGNLEFFTIAVGFIGPSLGLPLGWSILAGVSGMLFGTIFMAFHATQGPVMGLPQMIQTRAQMGYRGVSIALLAAFATYAGTCIAAIVLLSQGLKGTFGWDPTLVAVVSAGLATVAAIFGHDLLHKAFQVLLVVSLPFYLILTVAILTGGIAGGHPAPHGGFALTAFVAQFGAASAWNITYAPFVSDYSRYMPRDTSSKAIIAHVFLGAGGSAVWLVAVGAWLASRFGATDALVGLQQAGNGVFDGMGDILAVLSALALIGVMGLNTYSGHLTLLTAADSVRSIDPSKLLRIVITTAFAVAWLLAGLAVKPDAVTTVFTTLTLMLYLLIPWTSLNLVDYFFVRKGHYKIADLFTPDGIYGAWNWRGLAAYGLGIAVEVPFMVLPDIFTGPIAKAMNDVDIAFFVGLIVAGLGYYLLHRGQSHEVGSTIAPTDPDPAGAPVVAAGVGAP